MCHGCWLFATPHELPLADVHFFVIGPEVIGSFA